mmetsp:Transcript_16130/g.21333  ORF Transcript_16130/g.21333 Transcript_16130/m.21333 type:complete len:928 (+) Transcript_16130:228-3011(+)|eukprot:CAMPEP_0117755228 /NCGR_PEP_ID=MMETSP0947-20121206/13323_1 /TAXON_ID=44440 /ORGANISM="Chattonella subsalsa, Strain CCMP2191" /LENGTH=927 /DNA_ID=CAMNT_0005574515 /DNA_START=179 /DNA_END=2962 /DNA_ORIENTATION=-
MGEQAEKPGFLSRCSTTVDSFFQKSFYKWGLFVGNRPMLTIGISLLVMLICCSGFARFEQEGRPEKLWVPSGTEAQEDVAKYSSYFPGEVRRNYAIIEASDGGSALDKDVLKAMMSLHQEVEDISVEVSGETYTLMDLCVLVPTGGHPCLVTSVLGLWNYTMSLLEADDDPLATINSFIEEDERTDYMGGMETDDNGDLVSASALMLSYINQNNEENVGNDYVDVSGDAWEAEFIEIMQDDHDTLNIYPEASSSLYSEFGSAISGDVVLINVAFMVMFLYLSLGLGKFRSRLNSRYFLALAGLLCVGMSIGACYGLSAGLGFFYTPLHTVLPFVLLGLGVDDSFVIVNAFDQVPKDQPVPERLANALSHAAVSITVTSVTDFVAFLISTTSSLPALSSFCLYAAMGILFLFSFQVSFFSAFVAIDAKRVEAGRADCCPCCMVRRSVHEVPPVKDTNSTAGQEEKEENAPTTAPSERNIDDACGAKTDEGVLNKFLRTKYGPFLMKPVVKVGVLLLFSGLLVMGGVGSSKLTVEDATRSFIPDGSYLLTTLDKQDKYFGELGSDVYIVTETFDYFDKQDDLALITSELSGLEDASPYIQSPTKSGYYNWYDDYLEYVELMNTFGASISVDSDGQLTDEDEFYDNLAQFTRGMGYQYNDSIVFADDGSSITVTRIQAKYQSFSKYRNGRLINDANKQIAAMDDLRELVDSWDIGAFPWTFDYLTWETFKIIRQELIQGISLCLAAVFIITLVLIAHPATAFMVLVCVTFTVIEIMGVMYYWGLVIDNVAVIYLVLAVGLAVDYAAHIGHSFMLKQGTREERAIAALADIGSAVLNGAFSTFLAVVLLSASKSYVFRVMFNIFFVTVVLGVGHGVILLPVLLSICGPAAYANTHGHDSSASTEASRRTPEVKKLSSSSISVQPYSKKETV